jgi:uncharacterized membrane protein HdeD (DUF308 family)
MVGALSRNWWMLAVRGAVAVLFGIMAFIWPGLTLWALVFLFGAYVLIDGVFALVSAFTGRDTDDRWWVLLLEGLAGIAAGLIAFIWPGMAAFVLVYLIAAWAIVTGIIEIAAAIRLRKEIEGEWVLALSGLASIIFGVLMVFWPGAGALAVVWLIAAYAIFFGILLIFLAFRVRNRGVDFGGQVPHAT